ncbi:MAG: DUF262 domain-containing HNH endonuclease family protein [Acidocella sp.]|nr:DUF262 domain-containing HNH endonuclease family protein [Acidocella sp.]
MQLNPLHLKVATLLQGRLFRIPEYQRAYSWGTRQRNDLFEDIKEVARSGREHFMATVVALARDTRAIGADEYRTVELVDGQQRITTLIILLKAIEKSLSIEDPLQEKVKRETRELLVKSDEHSLILLQTNHDSSNVFTKYIRTGEIDTQPAITAADANLVSAARECERFVHNWGNDKPLIELIATLRNRLSMIYHELANEATVYRVFEVLNSRGLDVKWIDKLKSQLMALIFEHLEGGTRTEAVREMQTAWQGIYRTLGLRGDLGDEALRFAGTWALKSRPNRIISQEDAATELTKIAGTELRTIAGVGEFLKVVVEAVNELDGNIRLRAVTRIVHARFVATAILLRKFDSETQKKLLGVWERVTFRIFGLGGADARHKVGEYIRLGFEIIKENLPAEKIAEAIPRLGEGYSISEVLKGDWSDCYNGWSEELRYLLYRYDEKLSFEAKEKLNIGQWNKVWADEPSRSIEHIQPQSSGKRYIHHLGNLTMLPPSVNSSLKDKGPTDKATTYKECGLKATIAVGRTITNGQAWTEAAVKARTAEIIAFIRKEWSD